METIWPFIIIIAILGGISQGLDILPRKDRPTVLLILIGIIGGIVLIIQTAQFCLENPWTSLTIMMGIIFGGLILKKADQNRPRPKKPSQESSKYSIRINPQEINQLSWLNFEKLCVDWLKTAGYQAHRKTRTANWGADGGIDIEGQCPKENPFVAQCKNWSKNVGVSEIRNLIGAAPRTPNRVFFSGSNFTLDAVKLAHTENIRLVDAGEMSADFNSWPEEKKTQIWENIFTGDQTPHCPNCEVRMVTRKGRTPFWGCPNYPKCRNTQRQRTA